MYIETSDDRAFVERKILTDDDGELRISYVLDTGDGVPAEISISDRIRVAGDRSTDSADDTPLGVLDESTSKRREDHLSTAADAQSVANPQTNGSSNGRGETPDAIVGELSDRITRDPEPVVVGIPAYNEGSSIGAVVREVEAYADEIVVVDDGSDDDTADQARRAGAKTIEHGRNRGYGRALKTLFDYASRRGVGHFVILDGDGQHDASDVSALVSEQRQTGAEVVIANRFDSSGEKSIPTYRFFGLKCINLLTNLSMGVVFPQSYIGDTQSGFRSYSQVAVESIATDDQISDRMDASVDILFHAHQRNYEIREVPTTIDYDIEDTSTRGPIRHGYQLVKNILRTVEQERPLLSVGLPGLLLTITGIVLASVTVLRYTQTGGVTLELLFGSAISMLLGFLVCFAGILLHSLKTVGTVGAAE